MKTNQNNSVSILTILYLAKALEAINRHDDALLLYKYLLKVTNNCPTIKSDIELLLKHNHAIKNFNSHIIYDV